MQSIFARKLRKSTYQSKIASWILIPFNFFYWCLCRIFELFRWYLPKSAELQGMKAPISGTFITLRHRTMHFDAWNIRVLALSLFASLTSLRWIMVRHYIIYLIWAFLGQTLPWVLRQFSQRRMLLQPWMLFPFLFQAVAPVPVGRVTGGWEVRLWSRGSPGSTEPSARDGWWENSCPAVRT